MLTSQSPIFLQHRSCYSNIYNLFTSILFILQIYTKTIFQQRPLELLPLSVAIDFGTVQRAITIEITLPEDLEMVSLELLLISLLFYFVVRDPTRWHGREELAYNCLESLSHLLLCLYLAISIVFVRMSLDLHVYFDLRLQFCSICFLFALTSR